MRLATVQFGSVLSAQRHFAEGGAETFRGQRYSVEAALALQAKCEAALSITIAAPEPSDATEGNARYLSIADAYNQPGRGELLQALTDFQPTHLVVRCPYLPALEWGLEKNVRVLPALADSFGGYPLKLKAILTWLRTRRFVALTRRPEIDLVLNHNYSASQNLADIGVPAEKIAAYDWPAEMDLSAFEPKGLKPQGPYSVLYVGSVSEAKGVGDAAQAMGSTQWLQENVVLDLIGRGDGENFVSKAKASGGRAVFHGAIPNEEVFERMKAADLVIVPSRHSYAEGLPGTITEALTVRTPLLLSDHPMFTKALGNSPGASFFPAQNPSALGRQIEAILTDSDHYRALSEAAHTALQSTICTTSWGELIDRWMFGDHDGYLAAAKGKLQA